MHNLPSLNADCRNGFFETKEFGPLHWPKEPDLHFQLNSSFPEVYSEALQHSAIKYREMILSPRLSMSAAAHEFPFDGSTATVTGDGSNTIYWVSNHLWPWKESHPDAIAMTLTTYSQMGKLIEADIFFRATSFGDYSLEPDEDTSNTGNVSKVENSTLGMNQIAQATYHPGSDQMTMMEHFIYMVGLHELGHALGRCHSEDEDSIMHEETKLGSAESREKPFTKIDFVIFGSNYLVAPLEK